MLNSAKALFLMTALVSASSAFAAEGIRANVSEAKDSVVEEVRDRDYQHEISAAGSGLAFGGDQDVSFSANLGYSWLWKGMLEDNIQATAKLETIITDPLTSVGLQVGPTFNYKFGETTLTNAAFATATAGIAFSDVAAGTNTEFAYTVTVGKRFRINDFVTWKPTANLGKGSQFGTEDTTFLIVPLQFSFFL